MKSKNPVATYQKNSKKLAKELAEASALVMQYDEQVVFISQLRKRINSLYDYALYIEGEARNEAYDAIDQMFKSTVTLDETLASNRQQQIEAERQEIKDSIRERANRFKSMYGFIPEGTICKADLAWANS